MSIRKVIVSVHEGNRDCDSCGFESSSNGSYLRYPAYGC